VSRTRDVAGRLARRTPAVQRVLLERDDLRAEVHRLRAEVGRFAPRPDLGYVFIVTYGRSGSTLLQGILGAIPGWLIRGENGGAVYHLHKHFATVIERARPRRGKDLDATNPWYGIDKYPRNLALDELRAIVLSTLLRPEPGTRVVGFKEIRWQYPDLEDYLAFLRLLFPSARFVFNTRNHADVVNSQDGRRRPEGWWREGEEALKEVARVEGLQLAACEALGDAAYHVHYDDYVADPTTLRGLFAWLGEEFDEERVRRVMSVRHSY
jgi:hypothetical protein